MKKLALPLTFLGTLMVPLLQPAPVRAAADVTYVAPRTGADSNTATNCAAATPCQTLGAAISVTTDPGSVVITESATFAPISITTGLTISCPGVTCLFDESAGGAGITINAPGKGVLLAGVAATGFGNAASTGILVSDVTKLELKNVSVSGNGVGLSFSPGGGSTSHLYVLDSEIRNSSTQNIVIAPTSTTQASAVFTRSRIHHGNAGFKADATVGTGGVSVVISDSVVSFHNNNAINVLGNASGAAARVVLDHVVISHSSGNGIAATGATGIAALQNSMVTQTLTALATFSGGQIFSWGTNAIHFNTSDGVTPSSTPLK